MGLLIKKGVEFGTSLAPAGARILEVLKKVAAEGDFDITITSARDGVHSGSADPHHSGEAFDLRTKTLTPDQKQVLLTQLRQELYPQTPGALRRFYVVLEDAGGSNEHIHCQRRLGTTYSVYDFLANH